MTAVLDRPAASPAAAGPRLTHRVAAAAPWLLLALVWAFALWHFDTPKRAMALYAVYLVVGLVVPGTLVHRALRGSRGNLPEDLGLGAATGLLLQLAGWALAAATGLQQVLWAWPLLVLLVFAAVPALRGHWRVADPRPLPVAWSWAMAAALLGIVTWGAAAMAANPLPPATWAYYQDLMYHLALVQEMTRTMPFEVPQLAGEALRYHYLSDADMAAASMVTGIDPAIVLLRLWFVPIGAIAVLVVGVLARDVSGRWWAGPLAGGVAFAGLPLSLGSPIGANGGQALAFLSPSQTYAMPLLALLAVIAVDVLRGRASKALWFVIPPLALALSGAKSSALPPLVAGVALAGLVLWLRDRRLPWAVAGFGVATVIPMYVGTKLFAGGGAGVLALQPLSGLRYNDAYRGTLGGDDGITPGGLLNPGLQDADLKGWVFVAALMIWWALLQAPRLVGLFHLGRKRQDPVAWMLAGTMVAGAAAGWLFYHPSASQFYFIAGALPFGVVLTVWFLAEHVRRGWVPLAGLAAGALWQIFAPKVAKPEDTASYAQWAWALSLPLLRALAFVAAGALLVLILRKSFRSLLVAVVAATLGASFAAGAYNYVRNTLNTPSPYKSRIVTAAEMRAAIWLDDNAGEDDIVATNVHCQPLSGYKVCDARAFWVAGLGGHRTLVESWGYSDEAVAANGVDGRTYMQQPAPDQQEFQLNERVFSTGAAADVTALRDTYGVRWLFADTRAGAVSPELAKQATVRYTAGSVTVYELR